MTNDDRAPLVWLIPTIKGSWLTKLVVLYHHWSSLIWHEEEGFPSNVGLSKPKMTTSATLGLDENYPHNKPN